MGCCCCVAGEMQMGFLWGMHTGWPGTEMGAGNGQLLQVSCQQISDIWCYPLFILDGAEIEGDVKERTHRANPI